MKAQELRIGNLLYVGKSIGVVSEISEGSVKFEGRQHLYNLNGEGSLVKPIPLTEDRLGLMGFEYVKPRSGVASAYRRKSIRIEVSYSGNFYYKNKSIPYVHILQNLYFFNELSGEELKTDEL